MRDTTTSSAQSTSLMISSVKVILVFIGQILLNSTTGKGDSLNESESKFVVLCFVIDLNIDQLLQVYSSSVKKHEFHAMSQQIEIGMNIHICVLAD